MIGQLLIRQSARIELSSNVLTIIEQESGALASENADFDDFSDEHASGNNYNGSRHNTPSVDAGGGDVDGHQPSSSHGGPRLGRGGPDGGNDPAHLEPSWWDKVGRDIGSFFQDGGGEPPPGTSTEHRAVPGGRSGGSPPGGGVDNPRRVAKEDRPGQGRGGGRRGEDRPRP